jgi:hypothetical protein
VLRVTVGNVASERDARLCQRAKRFENRQISLGAARQRPSVRKLLKGNRPDVEQPVLPGDGRVSVMPRLKKEWQKRPSTPPAAPPLEVAGANMIDTVPSPLASDSYYFADRLKELRRRLVGKQLCLSCAVGCTDAAVSFWESGKRLPQQDTLSRILDALAQGGASQSELSNLHHSWRKAKASLRQPLRDDPPPSSR